MPPKQSRCPVCNSLSSFFREKDGYNCYFCDHCTTIFLNPLPSQKDINQRYTGYSDTYAEFEDRMKEGSKRTAEKICRLLRELNPEGQILLEVGSGYGFFLDTAKKYFKDVSGMEPIKNLYEYSKNQLKLDTTMETYQSYFHRHPDKKYDFIVLLHVIEHVLNPREIFMLAQKHLNKNGILLLETPNLDSHLFAAEKDAYTFLIPPEHLWVFSANSFKQLLQEFNELQLKKITTYSAPEHVSGVIKRNIKKLLRKNRAENNNQPQEVQVAEGVAGDGKNTSRPSYVKQVKYILFDRILSRLLCEPFSFWNKGSFLQVYIEKK